MKSTSHLTTFQKNISPSALTIICNPSHIRYLTGYEWLVTSEIEAVLFVTKDQSWLTHATFSPLPEAVPNNVKLLPGVYPTRLTQHWHNEIALYLNTHSITDVALDEEWMRVSQLRFFEKLFQESNAVASAADLTSLTTQRSIKDATEVTSLKTAGVIIATAVEKTLSYLESLKSVQSKLPTEQELAAYLEYQMALLGSQKPAFPTIVAYGAHTASPHHQPLDTKLTLNTPILIDCGATSDGYCSDITRTIWFGDTPSPKFLKIKHIVDSAYDISFKLLTTKLTNAQPVLTQEVDEAARNYITQAGFAKQFIHTTGHGVGLEIHEFPSVSLSDTTQLIEGMCITIEPGIYLENEVGYRYENTILLTNTSCLELTKL